MNTRLVVSPVGDNRLFYRCVLTPNNLCFKKRGRSTSARLPRVYVGAKLLLIESTHVSTVIDSHHIISPIDYGVAFVSPRVDLDFYRINLQDAFVNTNNAPSRWNNVRIYEPELEVPVLFEFFILVEMCQSVTNELILGLVDKKVHMAEGEFSTPHQNRGALRSDQAQGDAEPF